MVQFAEGGHDAPRSFAPPEERLHSG